MRESVPPFILMAGIGNVFFHPHRPLKGNCTRSDYFCLFICLLLGLFVCFVFLLLSYVLIQLLRPRTSYLRREEKITCPWITHRQIIIWSKCMHGAFTVMQD